MLVRVLGGLGLRAGVGKGLTAGEFRAQGLGLRVQGVLRLVA